MRKRFILPPNSLICTQFSLEILESGKISQKNKYFPFLKKDIAYFYKYAMLSTSSKEIPMHTSSQDFPFLLIDYFV